MAGGSEGGKNTAYLSFILHYAVCIPTGVDKSEDPATPALCDQINGDYIGPL